MKLILILIVLGISGCYKSEKFDKKTNLNSDSIKDLTLVQKSQALTKKLQKILDLFEKDTDTDKYILDTNINVKKNTGKQFLNQELAQATTKSNQQELLTETYVNKNSKVDLSQ